MIRRWGKGSLYLLLPLAGILFYYAGICNYSLLRQYPHTYQAVCGGTDASLTKGDYENMRETQEREESPFSYALWGKTEGIDVENPQFKRRFSVSLWKVRGNLEVLFNGFVKLQEQDVQGCYLDAETAQELFGSKEVVGSEILCQGRRLTIRGILEEERALLVVRPGEQETTDCITLQGGTALEAESFLLRYGITGAAVNGLFLREILQFLLLLFPISLAISLFQSLRGALAERFRWLLLLFSLFLIFWWVEIPETMIPDKWSNFQFWKNWWETSKDNAAAFFAGEKTGKEMAQAFCFLKGSVCAALSFLMGQMSFRMKIFMEAVDKRT